jgi:hypothetical protein
MNHCRAAVGARFFLEQHVEYFILDENARLRMIKPMLGIMVTKYENRDHIIGVVKAAHGAGHPVSVFMTDEGVKFTRDREFLDLLSAFNVKLSCCDHNYKQFGFSGKIEGVYFGSQFDNALMLQKSSRILVF